MMEQTKRDLSNCIQTIDHLLQNSQDQDNDSARYNELTFRSNVVNALARNNLLQRNTGRSAKRFFIGSAGQESGLLPANHKFTPALHAEYLRSLNQAVVNCLASINLWSFNIFDLHQYSNGRELMIVGY